MPSVRHAQAFGIMLIIASSYGLKDDIKTVAEKMGCVRAPAAGEPTADRSTTVWRHRRHGSSA